MLLYFIGRLMLCIIDKNYMFRYGHLFKDKKQLYLPKMTSNSWVWNWIIVSSSLVDRLMPYIIDKNYVFRYGYLSKDKI